MPHLSEQPAAQRALLTGLIMAAGFALTILAALIALAGLGRLTGDLDLAAVPGWFWHFRADPEVARWLRIGGLASGLLAVALTGAVLGRLRPPLHGAARWAQEGELVRAGLRSADGVVLGQKNGRLLTFGGAEHVLLYAPTRTGKGVGVVIPNLLTWPQSLIVLDIKRENWTASAGFRAAAGQTVFLFDPLAPDGRTARFNPLGHIDRADHVACVDELQKIAALLFPYPPRTDPFWSEAARTGFIGVGALVAETPSLPFTLGEIFRQLTRDDPRTRLPEEIATRAAAHQPLSAACINALKDFCASSENTFQSVRQTITSRMGLWLNPRVDWATAASDFELTHLRHRSITLYLGVTPDNLDRVAPLYNLLLQQFVDQNTRTLPDPKTPGRQVLVVLDEFARLGPAPVLAEGFSFLAGYGIRLLAVLQSPAQLRAAYGADRAEEIITNCGVEVVFAPKDIRVARDLSERLGYYGLQSQSQSRPMGLSAGRRSLTESTQRRALMLPQELLAMSDKALIVLRAGTPPVRGRKLRYFQEPAFMRRVVPPPVLEPCHDVRDGRDDPGPGGQPAARTEDPTMTAVREQPVDRALLRDQLDLANQDKARSLARRR